MRRMLLRCIYIFLNLKNLVLDLHQYIVPVLLVVMEKQLVWQIW